MRTIKHKQTLFFYDCAQVFWALDEIGGNYLCVLTGSNEKADAICALKKQIEVST